jgi:hypothetical protein
LCAALGTLIISCFYYFPDEPGIVKSLISILFVVAITEITQLFYLPLFFSLLFAFQTQITRYFGSSILLFILTVSVNFVFNSFTIMTTMHPDEPLWIIMINSVAVGVVTVSSTARKQQRMDADRS